MKHNGPYPRPPSERFWDKVEKRPAGACWNWQGSCEVNGYGILVAGRKKRVKAHRVSWEIHHGEIPPDLFVLHHCDNRKCVNPDHLYLGSKADNAHDRAVRKRGKEARQNGALNDNAKLTEKDVRAIIALLGAGWSQTKIAEMFDVVQPHISRIARRENWKHLWEERP